MTTFNTRKGHCWAKRKHAGELQSAAGGDGLYAARIAYVYVTNKAPNPIDTSA